MVWMACAAAGRQRWRIGWGRYWGFLFFIWMTIIFLSRREQRTGKISARGTWISAAWREVLLPLSRLQAVRTFRYNCREDKRTEDNREAAAFAIVEGTYCLHPRIRSYFGLTFFLSVTDLLQKSRLEAREGANYRNFLNLWIPMEKHYFQDLNPEENADFKIELDAEGRMIRCEETGKCGIIT